MKKQIKNLKKQNEIFFKCIELLKNKDMHADKVKYFYDTRDFDRTQSISDFVSDLYNAHCEKNKKSFKILVKLINKYPTYVDIANLFKNIKFNVFGSKFLRKHSEGEVNFYPKDISKIIDKNKNSFIKIKQGKNVFNNMFIDELTKEYEKLLKNEITESDFAEILSERGFSIMARDIKIPDDFELPDNFIDILENKVELSYDEKFIMTMIAATLSDGVYNIYQDPLLLSKFLGEKKVHQLEKAKLNIVENNNKIKNEIEEVKKIKDEIEEVKKIKDEIEEVKKIKDEILSLKEELELKIEKLSKLSTDKIIENAGDIDKVEVKKILEDDTKKKSTLILKNKDGTAKGILLLDKDLVKTVSNNIEYNRLKSKTQISMTDDELTKSYILESRKVEEDYYKEDLFNMVSDSLNGYIEQNNDDIELLAQNNEADTF